MRSCFTGEVFHSHKELGTVCRCDQLVVAEEESLVKVPAERFYLSVFGKVYLHAFI